MRPNSIEKILSPNDIGETGAHQAGFLIPKRGNVLLFFPTLNSKMLNPRSLIRALDDNGNVWDLSFIYYNNKHFGGTRNEYRLTGLTAFFRENNLKPEDTIRLTRLDNDEIRISFSRKNSPRSRIILSSKWKTINF